MIYNILLYHTHWLCAVAGGDSPSAAGICFAAVAASAVAVAAAGSEVWRSAAELAVVADRDPEATIPSTPWRCRRRPSPSNQHQICCCPG